MEMEDENQSDCENKTEMEVENDAEEQSSDEEDESLADTSEASETDVSETRPSCPICLRSLHCQQIGFPEDCSSVQHIFCALCIEEWAKNVTTCPIDRKEFTKICILDSWLNKTVIRSVTVSRKEYNEAGLEAVDDLTYCEICHLATNEHSMLLCDDCDRGYHMECLTPRLSQVPVGSWYCRVCATNRQAATQNVNNQEAIEDGIESSAESDTPRIIRTRATERIRAAIMTRGELLSSESEAEQPAQPQPGPSRIRTTLERVRRALKRGTRKRRRRRARRTTRSVVKEYDINSGDEKFPIKRTRGRVIRRKRKTKKRRTKKKSTKQSCKFTIPNQNNLNAGINAIRYNAGIPTVRLFEPANNLDYFSDEGNDEMEPVPVYRQNASRDVLTAIQSAHRIGSNRTLLKRKIIEPIHTSASLNILDSIMESQEKWHSKSGLSDSCTLKGGRPVFNSKGFKAPTNRPEVTQAPLNGTSNNGSTSVAPVQQSNNNHSTPDTTRTSGQSVDASETHQAPNSTGSGNNTDGNEGTGQSATFTPLPQRPQKTAASRKSFDIFGDDENKSCPNFSVYSSESMNLANENKKDESDPENNGDTSDERVDLVQLSGDEDEEEEEKEEPIPEEPPQETTEPEPVTEQTVTNDKPNDTQGKSQVLHLYDSDGGLDDELNKHFEGAPGEGNEEPYQAPDRSYTPCLDEKYPNKEIEGEEGELDKSATSVTGIDGMETELISEEEDSNLSGRDGDKNEGGNDKHPKSDKTGDKQPITPFKKVLNQRDRNYREKDRSRRRHSRDRSEDKENKSKKQINKKKEIQRYNVREVVTKASQRDPFGRTKPRDRSRSRSVPVRKRTKSRSRSKTSRSRSRSWSRKSFTISRSPSYSPRNASKRARTRTESPKRRVRSKSPVRRVARAIPTRRSFSRSPSRGPPLQRSKSPFRRKDPLKRKEKDKKKKKNRSKERKKRGQESRASDVEQQGIQWANSVQTRRASLTRHPSPSWTPPLGTLKGSQENLRVVLQNRDAAATTNRTKKKDKKKKSDKKKAKDRREHGRHRHEKTTESGKNRAAPTSKEVFASGDNILVSVSFNNTSTDKQPTQGEPDREVRRVERDPTKTLQLKDPIPPRPARKHRKIDTKPVAYIDLDGSPFNEAPASPVIVLSDSDHERDENERHADQTVDETQTEGEQIDECVRPASPPESPNAEEQFRLQAPSGPKTPPEPTTTSIKFSMPSKTRLRVMNNLFEDEDDEDTSTRTEKDQAAAQKIGPNTPPDPTPKSPDVYDPFEPTKSPSESPGQQDNTMDHDDGPLSRSSTPPLEETQVQQQQQQMLKEQEKINQLKPVDLVMSLVNKSIGSVSEKEKSGLSIDSLDEITETHLENEKPVEKQITILSNIVVQTPSKYNIKTTSRVQPATTPLKTPTRSPATGYKPGTNAQQKLSIKSLNSLQANTSGSIISKLPLPRTTSSKSQSGNAATSGMNDMEIDSPYSPGSNDYDDLFEPPSSTTDNYKPSVSHSKNVTSTTRGGGGVGGNKTDLFDNLFGSTSPIHKFSTVTTTYKINSKPNRKIRKSGKRSRFDDDEVPNSAVDLQVKDKLLRKLNRQERVIEEVKLVIKPHYNKKRITKEEYKEIMRKAVPKICHSRTGEINPVKIQALVEAYVRKVRQRRKIVSKMQPT